MRALSVKQPWASLIAQGEKTIELRTWSISPGPLAIVSSKAGAGNLSGGVLMCIVDVVESRPAREQDSLAALWPIEPGEKLTAVVLDNVRPTKQVPVRGKLGLFSIDVTIEPEERDESLAV